MKNNFGQNLRYYRKQNNLTQKELAQLIGVHRSTLTSYEINKRECGFDILLDIAKILNITTDELLK